MRIKRLIVGVATPALTFAAVLGMLTWINGSGSPEAPAAGSTGRAAFGTTTEDLIAELEQAAAESPTVQATLGDAYYQRARETGDQRFIDQAEDAYASALGRDPGDAAALAGQATLALTRHDFRGGLRLARRARESAPRSQAPYAPLVDAQIELGRYDEAARSIDRLVGLKPNLTAYTRVSYYRELNGDLRGAIEAMRAAVSAGSGNAENAAFARSLLGDLLAARGDYGDAEAVYREALAIDSGNSSALRGLAALEAGRGGFDAAIRRYRRVVEQTGLPADGYALAETLEAAGRRSEAARAYEAAARLTEPGVDTRSEQAVFEADHGDPELAVQLGRAGYRAAPSVSSADSLAWALLAAGDVATAARRSREAMGLGSRDPTFLFHAGMISAAAGDVERAERLLSRLLGQSPRFDPLGAAEAKRTLDELHRSGAS